MKFLAVLRDSLREAVDVMLSMRHERRVAPARARPAVIVSFRPRKSR